MGRKVKRVRGLKDGDGIEGTENEEGHEDGQWRRNGKWSVHDFLSAPHYLNNSIDLLRPQHPYVSFIWTHTHTNIYTGGQTWSVECTRGRVKPMSTAVYLCVCVWPQRKRAASGQTDIHLMNDTDLCQHLDRGTQARQAHVGQRLCFEADVWWNEECICNCVSVTAHSSRPIRSTRMKCADNHGPQNPYSDF